MIYTVSLTSKPLTPSTKKTVICYILLKMRFMIFFSPFKLRDFDNSFEGTVRLLTSIEESTANIEPLSFLGVVLGEKGYSKLSVCLQPGWSCCVVDDFYCISCMREVSYVLVGQYRPTIAVFCVLYLGSQKQLLLTPKKQRFGKNGWLW